MSHQQQLTFYQALVDLRKKELLSQSAIEQLEFLDINEQADQDDAVVDKWLVEDVKREVYRLAQVENLQLRSPGSVLSPQAYWQDITPYLESKVADGEAAKAVLDWINSLSKASPKNIHASDAPPNIREALERCRAPPHADRVTERDTTARQLNYFSSGKCMPGLPPADDSTPGPARQHSPRPGPQQPAAATQPHPEAPQQATTSTSPFDTPAPQLPVPILTTTSPSYSHPPAAPGAYHASSWQPYAFAQPQLDQTPHAPSSTYQHHLPPPSLFSPMPVPAHQQAPPPVPTFPNHASGGLPDSSQHTAGSVLDSTYMMESSEGFGGLESETCSNVNAAPAAHVSTAGTTGGKRATPPPKTRSRKRRRQPSCDDRRATPPPTRPRKRSPQPDCDGGRKPAHAVRPKRDEAQQEQAHLQRLVQDLRNAARQGAAARSRETVRAEVGAAAVPATVAPDAGAAWLAGMPAAPVAAAASAAVLAPAGDGSQPSVGSGGPSTSSGGPSTSSGGPSTSSSSAAPASRLQLSPAQATHSNHLQQILRTSAFAIDLSAAGCGKTYVALDVATRFLGGGGGGGSDGGGAAAAATACTAPLEQPAAAVARAPVRNVVVVSSTEVCAKWQKVAKELCLPGVVVTVATFSALRQGKTSNPCGDEPWDGAHQLLSVHEQEPRLFDPITGKRTKPFYVFEASEQFEAMLEDGTLVVLDEFQAFKNAGSQRGRAAAALVHAVHKRFVETGGRTASRALLLSATPVDKQEHMQAVFATALGLKDVRDRQLPLDCCERVLMEGILPHIHKLCMELDPHTTAEMCGILQAHLQGWLKLAKQSSRQQALHMYIQQLMVHVLLGCTASAMRPTPFPGNLRMITGFFRCRDSDSVQASGASADLAAAICSLDKALNEAAKQDNTMAGQVSARFGEITTAMQKIEKAKAPTMADLARAKLNADPRCKVVIAVSYNITVDHLCKELREFQPACVTGKVGHAKRREALELFQSDSVAPQHRLLIVNLSVCNAGIDLDDKHGNCPRVALVSPNYNSMELYQFARRFQRSSTAKGATAEVAYVYCIPHQEDGSTRRQAPCEPEVRVLAKLRDKYAVMQEVFHTAARLSHRLGVGGNGIGCGGGSDGSDSGGDGGGGGGGGAGSGGGGGDGCADGWGDGGAGAGAAAEDFEAVVGNTMLYQVEDPGKNQQHLYNVRSFLDGHQWEWRQWV